MKVMTAEELKLLKKHMDIARTEIQKTISDLGKGGVSLSAIHIIFLEAVMMTKQKMKESGTTEHGFKNCEKIAKASIERAELKK